MRTGIKGALTVIAMAVPFLFPGQAGAWFCAEEHQKIKVVASSTAAFDDEGSLWVDFVVTTRGGGPSEPVDKVRDIDCNFRTHVPGSPQDGGTGIPQDINPTVMFSSDNDPDGEYSCHGTFICQELQDGDNAVTVRGSVKVELCAGGSVEVPFKGGANVADICGPVD